MQTLAIYLEPTATSSVRVGSLIGEPSVTRFLIDPAYLERGADRPTASAAFWAPGDETRTRARLESQNGKFARAGGVPPLFANLLPEGALRDLIAAQLPSRPRDDFSLLSHLGADLPGALVARRENENEIRPKPPKKGRAKDARLKFSLAGMQLKFSMLRAGERFVLPSSGELGRVIVKTAPEDWPDLCESEFSALRLAESAGVQIVKAEVISGARVEGLAEDARVLVVDRFDRSAAGRVHTEEFASVFGLPPVAKYGVSVETVFKLIARFSSRGAEDVLEAVRRLTVDLLLGNGDAHLKNFAFLYPDGRRPMLSPAYDIVPTIAYIEGDDLALKLGRSSAFARAGRKKLARLSRSADLPEAMILDQVDRVLTHAVERWPALLENLPLATPRRAALARHWATLPLTRPLPNPFARRAKPIRLCRGPVRVAEVERVRPHPRNPRTRRWIEFRLSPETVVDLAQEYELALARGRRVPLRLVSLAHPRSGRFVRVVAEALDAGDGDR